MKPQPPPDWHQRVEFAAWGVIILVGFIAAVLPFLPFLPG